MISVLRWPRPLALPPAPAHLAVLQVDLAVVDPAGGDGQLLVLGQTHRGAIDVLAGVEDPSVARVLHDQVQCDVSDRSGTEKAKVVGGLDVDLVAAATVAGSGRVNRPRLDRADRRGALRALLSLIHADERGNRVELFRPWAAAAQGGGVARRCSGFGFYVHHGRRDRCCAAVGNRSLRAEAGWLCHLVLLRFAQAAAAANWSSASMRERIS